MQSRELFKAQRDFFAFQHTEVSSTLEGVKEVVCEAVSYKTVSPVQLCNVVAAFNEKLISFRALRVYLGCLELVAIREAAARYRQKLGEKRGGDLRLYKVEELITLTGASASGVRRELSALQNATLLTFSPSCIAITETPLTVSSELLHAAQGKRSIFRPIPVPRRFLRFLAGCQSPAMVKTAIAYFLRGLSLHRTTGTINARGTVKLSWIASLMQLSERAARYARGTLIKLGWFTRDTTSYQRKLNRDGAYFVLNVAWKPTEAQQHDSEEAGDSVDKNLTLMLKNAPQKPHNCPEIAPLNKRLETPYRVKNQETLGSGVSLKLQSPTLSHVVREDLEHFSRTENLYWQAVRKGSIAHSEATALAFLGAAIRAKTVRQGDPVRIFLGILQQHLWHHITQDQEERARRALMRFREQDPLVFHVPPEERQHSSRPSCHALLQRVGINLTKLAA